MMKRSITAILLVPLVLILSGFQARQGQAPAAVSMQPNGERAVQNQLPQSHSTFWAQVAKCKVSYNETTQLIEIDLTPEVKALDGQTIETTGFVLPLDAADKTTHFLLTKRTPVCFFCPPGSPNEVLEVHTSEPVEWTNQLVAMEGKLKLINDGEVGVFFELEKARVKK